MIATLISHTSCHQHHMPAGHPECPERIDAITNQLMANGIDGLLYQREGVCAEKERIFAVIPEQPQ